MRLRTLVPSFLLAAAVLSAGILLGVLREAPSASAQAGTGTITGQVVWNSPVPVVYGAPGMLAPGVEAEPPGEPTGSMPEATPSGEGRALPGVGGSQGVPAPGVTIPIRPPVPRPIPAGAVLVAVQGTALGARTDENGRFSIGGVPAGQFLTVAAGPVQGISTAYVMRPNVVVNPGQTVDLGRLYLGQQYRFGPLPYGAPSADEPQREATP